MLGLAACQNEPEGLDVIAGGEVDMTLNVAVPNSETRAGGLDSALGVFDNGILGTEDDDTTMRYILQIYNDGTPIERKVAYSDNKSVSFDVRLVPNRDYRFVVWADVVVNGKNDTDNHYNTEDLTNITLNDTWMAMDESRDAFTATYDTADHFNDGYTSSSSINITLKRPFAKLRIITTDMAVLSMQGIVPTKATVKYTTNHRQAFDAYSGLAKSADMQNMEHTSYTIAAYGTESGTLFTDYFFADNDISKFEFWVYDQNNDLIKYNNFNTDINVRRNYLTTISGNILTDGNNIKVSIIDAFDNQGDTTDPNYNIGTISSLGELVAAIENGGNYVIISDLNISSGASTLSASLLASEPKQTIINLNGKTITVHNTASAPLITVADGSVLTLTGDGTIIVTSDSTTAFIDNNGTINLEGGTLTTDSVAVIDNSNGTTNVNGGEPTEGAINGGAVNSVTDLINNVLTNGGELTLHEDVTFTEALLVTTTNPIIIDGNGHTLTTSATRAIRLTVGEANVTISNLNTVVTAERIGTNDIRGISIDGNIDNVILTLNNSHVDFTSPSAHDWAYGVNLAGNSDGHTLTINGGSYEGANVVNVWGDNHIITVNGATLTSLYKANEWYCGQGIAIEGTGNVVNVSNNIFIGENAMPIGATDASANTFNIGNNNTEAMNYYRFMEGSNFYYTLAEAFSATTEGTIKIIKDVELSDIATVAHGKNIVLNLNGKNVTGTDMTTTNFSIIDNRGNLTITGPGTITLTAQNNNGWERYSAVVANNPGGLLTIDADVTIEHLGGTDMAYGIDNLTNGKGTSAVTVINGATVKSPYRAVRQFLNGIEADNTLIVKAGSTLDGKNKSIFFQDPSTYANTGTLIVEEGATLNGDVYLFVTEGSTEWPVEVSIAASSVNGEVLSANVPAGYIVEELNGTYTVTKGKIQDGIYQPNDNTYAVSNEDGLAWIYANMAANNNYEGMTIELACDITLNRAWTPLGTVDAPFAGSFDGKGYTISNLTVADIDYAAFIAYAAEDITIKDLTLENVAIQSTKHAAGVVCIGGDGITLDNITISGSIEAANYAGGICHNISNVRITNCVNNASVSAQRAAGIASWAASNAIISGVENHGDIMGSIGASGIAHGFAGTITEAVNHGDITSTGTEPAAGIAGVQKGASAYEYCVNYGTITSTVDNPNSSAAGILGQTPGTTALLSYCANYGTITAEQCYAAGIAYSLYGSINASYCYNNGAVSGADGAGGIAPKAQYGSGDKASYCLNGGAVTSSNGIAYQASNNNTSCYYYNNGSLLNVGSNTVANVNEALTILNNGADSDFFAINNGVISTK